MDVLTISELNRFARVQMAAESLFEKDARKNSKLTPGQIADKNSLTVASLTTGNGHASKFTETDATQFVSEWTLVEHISNTKSGFSGTLFYSDKTKEYVLSCRSTEFIDDAVRDCQATNKLEIQDKGWSFGQLSDLEDWYQSSVKNIVGKITLNVTGYSLGGHLATAFNLMHESELNNGKVVTFNGAGVAGREHTLLNF